MFNWEVSYRNSNGDVVEFGFDTKIFIDDNELFNYEWDVRTVSNRISSLSRGVRDITMTVSFVMLDEDIRTKFANMVEYDARTNQCGTLTVNGWSIDGMFTASKASNYHMSKRFMQREMTFTTQSALWYQETPVEFSVQDNMVVSGKIYPYAYTFDYGQSITTNNVMVDGNLPVEFKLVIYGPATNPEVKINNHSYKVNATVEQSGYLVVDSKSKTITLVGRNGNLTNVFSKQDKTSYIFEKVPAGSSPVTWNNSFGWSLIIVEERSEPEWI